MCRNSVNKASVRQELAQKKRIILILRWEAARDVELFFVPGNRT